MHESTDRRRGRSVNWLWKDRHGYSLHRCEGCGSSIVVFGEEKNVADGTEGHQAPS